MKVLIVDPDGARAATVADALTGTGAEPAVAPCASFALTMLEWNRQDVIISRAHVGDMEGHELCAIVRSDPSTVGVRFVLIAGGVRPSQMAQIGIDLVIPDGLIGPAIVTRVMHLMRRKSESAAPPGVSAAPPAEILPSPVPAPPLVAPVAAPPEPPLAIVPTPAPTPVAAPAAVPAPPPPEAAPPPVPAQPPPETAAAPVPAPPPPATAPLPLPAPPPPETAPLPVPAPPPPVTEAPARAINPLLKGAAPPPPPLTELEAVGMNGATRTFQGALGSLALEDLAQAIVKGSKTGRLLVVLSTGGGMIAFDGGRVVHAEVGNTTGETAFQSLVAASHRESGGKFCFIPSAPRDLASVPKTITRSVAELLSGAAQATNEER